MSLDSAFSLAVILEKISAMTVQIQQGQALEDILQWAIADIRMFLQTDRVLIYRFLPNQDAVVAFESVGAEWTPILGQLIYDPCLADTWVERFQQGQTTAIADVHSGTLDPCYVQLLEELQVQANLVMPILSQGHLWGLLIAHQCQSPREWRPLEHQLLQYYALQLGGAVQQGALRHHQKCLERQLESCTVDCHQAENTLHAKQEACLMGIVGDASHHQAVAVAPPDGEARYRHLVEHLNAGVVVYAPDTQSLQCNAAACARGAYRAIGLANSDRSSMAF